MNLRLHLPFAIHNSAVVKIAGSKSETNRLLLLQALFPGIELDNVSDSDDSDAMRNALKSQSGIIDIGHAGTAMRFLTAYYALLENRTVILTGSARMQQRPIGILVDALRQLGAEIQYVQDEGFPPLKITGKKITQSKITLRADVSSQYISALLLIAPKLENGLELTLDGAITSRPYIVMTLSLLNAIGVETSFAGNVITVFPKAIAPKVLAIESDWSSASYFYSIVALSGIGTAITLSIFKGDSVQGDRALVEMYRQFGVETIFGDASITIRKVSKCDCPEVTFDLNDTPDLAQTVAVTCLGLGIGCGLTGLQTLKVKETDRLEALKKELEKLGARVVVKEDAIKMVPGGGIPEGALIKTYDDHRMAMAFAPLAVSVPIIIENAEVVSKSYPAFWQDLKAIGFNVEM